MNEQGLCVKQKQHKVFHDQNKTDATGDEVEGFRWSDTRDWGIGIMVMVKWDCVYKVQHEILSYQ